MSDDLQELKEQTDPGTRAESGADGDENDQDELEDAIVELLGDVEDGSTSKTLSVRDERLAALVRALEQTGEIDDVGGAFNEQLGRDPNSDDVDRSELLRLAVRLGLQEAAPEVLDTARDAYARRASEQF